MAGGIVWTLRLQVVVLALVMMHVAGQVDRTRMEMATGSDVVENVVELVRSSCVLSQDNMLLRRLAYVESHDGTEPDTFRAGFYGGIWQIDQRTYETTKTSPYLQGLRDDIQTHLGIHWASTQWRNLLMPLYSGLAAALHISDVLRGAGYPTTVADQQSFWATRYHRGVTTPGEFTQLVRVMDVGCKSQSLLDLAFIIDTSSSISQADFEAAKKFITDVISFFDLSSGNTRVALITYASEARVRLNWVTSRPQSSVSATIHGLTYESGGTETAAALDLARTNLFNHARSNAVKVLVLVTDGASHDRIDTNHAAEQLHNAGDILVLAVGVGAETNLDELHTIASNPACKHTFQVAAYDQINAIKDEIQQITCRAPLILNVNQTVSCAMCHCSPYAVPIPSGNRVRIEAASTCGSPVHLYTAYDHAYPGSSFSQSSLTVSGSSSQALLVPAPRANGDYYYVNVDQSSSGACSSGCIVTIKALIHDVRVVCIENGVQRTCTHDDILNFAPGLLHA